MRIWYRLVTISMTSPKHTCLRTVRFANLVNLSYVTARVSHRPQTLYGHIMNTVRKDSAVHVSLSSYLIVKQHGLVKQNSVINQNSLINPATRLAPGAETPSSRR